MNSIKNLSLLAVLMSVGCATANPPRELLNARAAYNAAAVDAAKDAPTELHSAKVALDAAERTFADEPNSVEVKDRAYIAQRRAELAKSKAAIYAANEQRDAANAKLQSLGAAAVSELRDTKEELSASEQKARAADRTAAGLKSDLKVSESKGEDLKTQLADEKMARKEAEMKLTATLQSMADLKSVKEEPRGLVITLSGAVLFASGKYMLLPAAQKALDNVAEALKATPERMITVEGHTDSQGSQQSNMELSQRRSEAVRTYLVSRGIPDASITAAGFGPNRPVADNASTDGRANNRRVEIILAPAPENR